MKQWVTKSDRYSPTFSDANVEWGFYYGIATTACRVRSPQGDKGLTGDQGEKGPQGDKGLTGDKGATGDKGPTGERGPLEQADWQDV